MYRSPVRRVFLVALLLVSGLLVQVPLRAEYHIYHARTSFTEVSDQSPGRRHTRSWEDPDGSRTVPFPAPRDTFVVLEETWKTCTASPWTTNDVTAQSEAWFHVDTNGAINGAKSLWCGTTGGGAACDFRTPPGYGNSWNQAWCTKNPVSVSNDLQLDVSFKGVFNSEPVLDQTTLEYTTDVTGLTGWTVLYGNNTGPAQWDDNTGSVTINDTFPVSGSPVLVRFRFHSSASGSDEDGQWPSNGAVHIDDLKVEALALEDFESTATGAISTNDWQFTDPGAYGQKMGLFTRTATTPFGGLCIDDLNCRWAALVATTANFSCGGFPSTPAVPYSDAAGNSLFSEMISPEVPLFGSGNEFRLRLSVLPSPLDNLVFYTWRVRTNDALCRGAWKGPDYMYYGGQEIQNSVQESSFIDQFESIGAYVDTSKPKLQLSIAVVDMSSLWAGVYGSGLCHSAAPLIAGLRLDRINSPGPQWSIRDIDQFQDTFGDPNNFPATVPADIAQSLANPASTGVIIPGDSAVVTVFDPAGLANDTAIGGKQVYAFVQVLRTQASKVGTRLSGGPRWPVASILTIGPYGTWTALRMDPCIQNGAPATDRYCVDLNDNLFQPGDTIQFFYGAQNVNGDVTYAFGNNLARRGTDLVEAAGNASEFTIFPSRAAGLPAFASDILYVDATDGRGDQPFFDDAFKLLGLEGKVDRFDIRGPSSGVNNNLRSRVPDVAILSYYRRIIYDTGDLHSFSTGNTNPSTDDFELLNDFLVSLTTTGGVYLCGDNAAEQLNNSPTFGAVLLRSQFIPFTLINKDHRLAPSNFLISPKIFPWPGRNLIGDDFVLYGGCPELHEFDVIGAAGPSQVEMSYNTASNSNGAVVSNASSSTNILARFVLSGFSFASIRDNDLNGISDRALHLYRILLFLGGGVEGFPSAAGPAISNHLSQNYPNPFNPSTTIGFSIHDRGLVSLVVYGVDGQRIRTLAGEVMKPGAYTRDWDGRDDRGQPVASGVYFYKINATKFTATKKLVLLK